MDHLAEQSEIVFEFVQLTEHEIDANLGRLRQLIDLP